MLKMNPRYLQEFFGESIGPPKGNRTTEKVRVRDIKGLVLRNKESIIYKRND